MLLNKISERPDYGSSLKSYLETLRTTAGFEPGLPRGFTKAHKVPNFALNLIAPNLSGEKGESGNVVYNDLYEWNSTTERSCSYLGH